MEEDHLPNIKQPSFDLSRFSVETTSQNEEFGEYVALTAKLINRSFGQTFKLVETWPKEKLIRHYNLCTKHAGDMPGDVKWWWLRKKNKERI